MKHAGKHEGALFTLEAIPYPDLHHYRLTKNQSWRKIAIDERIDPEQDALFSNPKEAQKIHAKVMTLVLEGKEYLVNPSSASLTDNVIELQPIIHRTRKPRQFTKKEIQDTIAQGNDNQNNTLIIDLSGHVRLYKFSGKVTTSPTIATRQETFCAGNDYVGPKAAQDNKHLTEVYLSALYGWLIHLKTGRPNIFIDFTPPNTTEENLLQEIKKIVAHLP